MALTIYISGAITGEADFEKNFEAAKRRFSDWALAYLNEPCAYINPCHIGKVIGHDRSHDRYMDLCHYLWRTEKPDILLLAKGWRDSVGANEEKRWAESSGCLIIEADDLPHDGETIELIKELEASAWTHNS